MENLINNPAIQSGLLPFAVTLIGYFLLRPLGKFRSGTAVMIAFFTTVVLTMGLQFSPLSATRKIALLGGMAFLTGIAIEYLRIPKRVIFTALITLSIIATLWLISPLLKREEGLEFILLAGSAILFSIWVCGSYTLMQQSNQTNRLLISLTCMALSLGVSAIFGASALLGQLSLAIGSALSAVLILHLLGKAPNIHSSLILPVILLLTLIGFSAVTFSRMPWLSLLILSLIPLLERAPLPDLGSKWLQALWIAIPAATTGVAAILISKELAGGMAY